MVVLDPSAKRPTLDFFSTNYEQLKVRLFQVQPGDLDKYNAYHRAAETQATGMPGRKVFDQLVKTASTKNTLVETRVDLQLALSRTGLGHAIAVVEPYPWKEDYDPPRLISWVQSTKLAVDAFVDSDNLIAFATELGTGKPASGVTLEIRPFGIKADRRQGHGDVAAGRKTKELALPRRGAASAFVADNGYEGETAAG
jgi:uncharacterized protein YfaS (alpha-2-macroglobulin family)